VRVSRIGLTGGIASGKSTVSERLAALGAVVIDSDRLAREVVAPGTAGLAQVLEAFGPGILTPDGDLDRSRLAERVFHDQAARRRLEAIVHPLVQARAAEIEQAAPAGSVIVHDIPLLVESGQQDRFDRVVVVDVEEAVQLYRLRELRGLSKEAAQARVAAQASRQDRLATANHVLVNNGTPEDLVAAVDRLWPELTR